MIKIPVYIILFTLLISFSATAQSDTTTIATDSTNELSLIDTSRVYYDSTDVEIFYQLYDSALIVGVDSLSTSELCIWIGEYFGGRDYIYNTATPKVEKKVIVNLRGFDCVTLVENSVALSQVIQQKNRSFISYIDKLEENRYRGGELGDYPIRLHYFSEWITDNQKRGLVTDITKDLDSIPYNKTIDFMTKNRAKYNRLKDNDTLYNAMLEVEKELNKRQLYYIPKDSIPLIESKIQNGDIVVFATSIKGLDVSHVGFAVWKGDRLHLMHASSQFKKVIISEKPIYEYTAGKKYQSGIIVARIKN